MDPEQFSKSQWSSRNTSSGVCIINGLQEEEKAATYQRSPKVLEALQNLGIQADKAPVIAVLGSGGGLRAHIACLGVLSEMKELGLLDTVMYLAGVSGSTWALTSFYTNKGNVEGMEEELKHRYEACEWSLEENLEKTIQAARIENYSLTDFWAYLVVSRQTRELQDYCLSDVKKEVEEGTLPYPIFAAVDGDLLPVWKERKAQTSWFEFTPHHAGYPALRAYVPITQFGSRFEKGKLVESKPERDLTFLRGLWGSALANLEEIKTFILNYLKSLKEKLKIRTGLFGAYPSTEVVGIAGACPSTELVGTAVDEALLDLVMAYVQDRNDPSIQEKLLALQQALSERGQSGELELNSLAEMSQNWNKISPEEQEQFLEYLVYCFTRVEDETKGDVMYSLGIQLSRSWFGDKLRDILTFLYKTGICCWKWEWGTIHNFLYKHGNITDEAIHSREFLHLIDAGLAINTAYPLVLPPTREVDLILSFDFSDGDPLETIRATADYCRLHKIPFPQVEENQLKEWARAPAGCYVLKGETGPVVMHFTLFNKDNLHCQDNIETWRKKYHTIKLSDTYTPNLVTDLLMISKENVRMNKNQILSEMQKVARKLQKFQEVPQERYLEHTVKDVQCSRKVEIKISNNTGLTFTDPLEPQKFQEVHQEGSLEYTVKDVQCSRKVEIKISNNTGLTFTDPLEPQKFQEVHQKGSLKYTVKDVQCSRKVEIKISNNTGLTFTDPLLYFQSGHASEDPPSALLPQSTVTCSFVNKCSSFEGTVGLLIYQGPDFHLAILFSAPFSYALHRIEFALAVLTGPICGEPKSVFENIIQGKESQELKVAKCVLRVPQGTLKLEHGSLIIRATVSNIHMAKMNVVVEAKAS